MSDLYDEKNPGQEQENQENWEAKEENLTEEKGTSEEKETLTYSWVSPKLQNQQESEEDTAANPWGSGASAWRTETGSAAGKSGVGAASGDTKEKDSAEKTTDRGFGAGTGAGETWSEGNRAQRRTVRQRRPGAAATSPAGKKNSGSGRRWTTTVASAVVFGLVAGLVFTGVSVAGQKLTKQPEVNEVRIAAATEAAPEQAASAAFQADTVSQGGTVADVAAQCMPSLVTISTISVEEMRSFFGQTQQYEVEGAGTGVIVGQNDTELLIATNNHVVSGAKSLSVGFIDETAVEGSIKGYDSSTDLAVVAVNLEDIAAETMDSIRICEMGNSDDLVLGEQVVAIGNALGYGQSVTSGYISAFDRELNLSDGSFSFTSTGLIQTDASINSGNSGGALLNMRGQLIGINEAKSSGSSSSAYVDNIGFAIPISKAEPILENLMTLTTRSRVEESKKAYIGITCADVNSETAEMYNMPTGVCLTSIMEGSPAEEAGLKKGDILTHFDGREINTYSELIDLLQYYPAGESVEMVVQRSDEGEYSERSIVLTLGSADKMPESYQNGQGNQGRGFQEP
ncbi:MAG: trypsin-like peptidase domain-containing protein [Lachnospiraceae bacterium]|nr:trypsin-like peptidase domain-containing protein [Lachnospiraceae bacterium]